MSLHHEDGTSMKLASFLSTAPLGAVLLAGALGACRGTATPLPIQAAVTAAPRPPTPPTPFGPAAIDEALRAEWSREGITPASRVDDARFLRRVYLDVVGTVPPGPAVSEFMADASPDKRTRLVERLLASPAYAAYWATYWEATLVGWHTREQIVDRRALREWLEGEFTANTPWDKIVTALLTATGQNSHGGKRQEGAPGGQEETAEADSAPINGAVNWFLKYKDTPQDIAGNASRLFLGVQIQCAQCHDHKTEKWTQDDFRRFAACFARTRTEPIDHGKVVGLRRAMVVDIGRPLPRFMKNPDLAPIVQAEPTTLDGVEVGATPDVRQALAAWVTAKDNPWFAKAIVNRMWGHFLGRGFADPIDDMRDSNPPAMPDLLARLAADFTEHHDDLKALIRTITATEVYQLAPAQGAPGGSASDGERLWARFHISPLGPNELLRSILDVTDVESLLATRHVNLDRIRFQIYQRYSFLFDLDEDFAETDFEGTVAQALTLLNGELVGGGTSGVPDGALDKILAQPGSDADKITALYVRTITRAPSASELSYWAHYVNEPHPVETVLDPAVTAPRVGSATAATPLQKKNGKPGKGNKPLGPDALARIEGRDVTFHPDSRRQAYADLFWALLNSSEFTFNH
jgi:hypothetical protein